MGSETGAGETARTLLGSRYELLDVIGRGGMADVFRALDHRTDRQVAVKLFRPGVGLADTPRRLRREVDLLAAMRHPALVRVFDADVGDDAIHQHRAYLVMDLVDGPTLAERLRRQRLTATEVAGLGAALCAALAYVHERGIVHRDVKPANVLLPRTGDTDIVAAKLTDFGIAHVVDSTRLTTDGLTIGTANYLSPEQVRGVRVSPASDVYSLGLVLLESFTGQPTYPGHGVEAAIARLHRPPAVPPDLPPRLRDVLIRMTARDPHVRPTAALAGAELRQAAEPSLHSELFALDAAPVDEPTALIMPGQHRRMPGRRLDGALRVGAAAVVVLALLAALGAYFGSGPISGGAGAVPSSPSQAPGSAPASAAASSTGRPASPVTLRSPSPSPSPSLPGADHSKSVVAVAASRSQSGARTAVRSAPAPGNQRSKKPKKPKKH